MAHPGVGGAYKRFGVLKAWVLNFREALTRCAFLDVQSVTNAQDFSSCCVPWVDGNRCVKGSRGQKDYQA